MVLKRIILVYNRRKVIKGRLLDFEETERY